MKCPILSSIENGKEIDNLHQDDEKTAKPHKVTDKS